MIILQAPETLARSSSNQPIDNVDRFSSAAPVDLLVQDESIVFQRGLSASAARRGLSVVSCRSFEESLRIASLCVPRICLVDVSWKTSDAAAALVHSLKQAQPCAEVILMTATPSIAAAVTSIKAGASNYLPKSLGPDAILKAILNVQDVPEVRTKPMNPDRVYWGTHTAHLAPKRGECLSDCAQVENASADLATYLEKIRAAGITVAYAVIFECSSSASKKIWK